MRPGTCIHFTGMRHNEKCAAGICYLDVLPEPTRQTGSMLRLPCHSVLHWDNPSDGQKEEFAKRGTCEKYREPTTEEIATHEASWEKHFEDTNRARAAIILHAEGTRGIAGKLPCPVCTKGELRYSIAGSNGHVHACCSTPDCVNWVE